MCQGSAGVSASLCGRYLQSNVAELTALSQSVHFGHGGVQEILILKDQITIWNHLGKFCRQRIKTIKKCLPNKMTDHVSVPPSVQHALSCAVVHCNCWLY